MVYEVRDALACVANVPADVVEADVVWVYAADDRTVGWDIARIAHFMILDN